MTHNLDEQRLQIREDLVHVWRAAEYDHDAIGKAIDEIDRLRDVAEHGQGYDGNGHYGIYGNHCMNMGQFDAGECWLCQVKELKAKATHMQLAAGRYQYMHEHAQKAINSIDDMFEYQYEYMDRLAIKNTVQAALAKYTEAVSKVKNSK